MIESGACFPRPQDCPEYAREVCGCDGYSYDNPCFLAEAGMSLAYVGRCVPGDLNLDGQTTTEGDFSSFYYGCLEGPDVPYTGPMCHMVDFNFDQDVDLEDFRMFQDVCEEQ